MSRPDDPNDNGELPAEEEDSDDDELDGASQADSTASDGSQASGAGGTGKKKKKKKKGKKKKGGAENGPASAEAPASTAPKVDKAEADRRFNTALAAIKSEDPWIELSSSNLQDAKLKKLLEQLKKNDSITSLNLSQNALSDEGAQAIAAALGAGASVPGLITLDLRENNFSPQGLTILEGLTKVRRSLSIMTGPIIVQSEAPAAGKAGEKAMGHLNDSRLVRKYFQIGNEDDDSPSNGPQALPDLSINPTDLWQQLDGALAQGVTGIPSQSVLLKTLSQQVNSELSSIPDGAYIKHMFRCPHVNACLGRLQTLVTILELTPPPVTVQYSKQPQPAVGSHRVFVSEAIATLVTSQNTVIDEQLAAAKLVPRILHLAISHPLCSALHARSLKLIKAGLVSKVDDLLGPVMSQPGWGLGLQDPQASPDQEDGGEEGKPLCRPLPLVLASRGEAAIGVVSGSRSAMMGFVIEASKDLQKVIHPPEDSDDYDDDVDAQLFNPTIKRALVASSGWCDYATQEPSGLLSQLAKEQEGDLGGPRAQRPVAAEGLHLAELAGGGLITGHEILALLQGMNTSL